MAQDIFTEWEKGNVLSEREEMSLPRAGSCGKQREMRERGSGGLQGERREKEKDKNLSEKERPGTSAEGEKRDREEE